MRGGPTTTLLALTLTAFAASGCSSMSNLLDTSSSSTDSSASASAPARPAPASGSTAAAPAAGAAPGTATAAATPYGGSATDEYECPDVTVRVGTGTLLVNNAKPVGAELTANDVRYQGTFVRFSRECSARSGTMNMKVGVQGRVISGPAGGPGTVEVPLRLAVVQEGPEPKTVVSKFVNIPVTVGTDAGYVDFTHVDQDVNFPLPRNAQDMSNYVVYVGFDPGAAQKPKPAAPARRKR